MNNDTRLNQTPVQRRFQLPTWSSLTYPQKFVGIALIFALSLLAFLPLILEQNTRIENYGRKESLGTTYLGFLWQLSSDLQNLHITSIEFQNGTGAEERLNDAVIRVEADIIALESASQQYATPLGIDVDLKEINSKWSNLRSAVQAKNSLDAEAGFISLANSTNTLVKETGDKSYLILDPNLDTYYLIDTGLLNLPENRDLTFQIWQIANEAAVSKDLSPDKKFELNAAVNRLEFNLDQLDQNLQISIANNAGGGTEAIISLPLRNYLASTQSFINLINTYFLTSQTIQISPDVLKASYSGVRDTNEILYESVSQALTDGINTRIGALSFRLYFSILLATLSILIAYIAGSRIMRTISLPLYDLLAATRKLAAGDMDVRISTINTHDEAGQVALAFNALADELENNRQTLQTRAVELERRSAELEAIAEVARDISIIRDMNTMLNVATSLIRERFGFYHTGIFLVDERNEYVILRSASGPSSQYLLDQNYKLKIGGVDVVGGVAQTGQAQIAVFTEADKSLKNQQLPDTRSQIGLPLRAKSLTIGVLDIHSNNENVFTKREVQVFQILADQLSTAIDNAQLAQQIETTLDQLSIANRTQTKRNWDNTLARQNLAFQYDGFQIQAVPQDLPDQLMQQLEDGKPIILNRTGALAKNTLLVPLLLSGQVIGVIGLEREKQNIDWTSEEISIAEAAANRAAITLENARLLAESQRRASKEQAISEATSRISSALSIEKILGVTAEELERVIGDSEVILQIKSDDKTSSVE
jgi:GAF domain-containing protein/HAMP domain-containing protein